LYLPLLKQIFLNNVLHIPQATRNLAFVHRLTADNVVFLELHPSFYLIKDQQTRRTLLHDRCEVGLYPIPTTVSPSGKACLSIIKPSTLQWHDRLGHASYKIVSRVLLCSCVMCRVHHRNHKMWIIRCCLLEILISWHGGLVICPWIRVPQ
jgi:hypothetical protein